MNIWELLGIEPTRDKTEIRKAFAEKSKYFHPEESPEKFIELRNAYKRALLFAEQGTVSIEDDFSPIEEPEEGEQEEFIGLYPPKSEEKEKLSQRGERLVGEAEMIFQTKAGLRSPRCWKKYFEKSEYRWEKRNPVFLYELMSLIQREKVPMKAWYRVMEPELQKLADSWKRTDLGNCILEVRSEKQEEYNDEARAHLEMKQIGVAGSTGEKSRYLPQGALAAAVLLAAAFLFIYFVSDGEHKKKLDEPPKAESEAAAKSEDDFEKIVYGGRVPQIKEKTPVFPILTPAKEVSKQENVLDSLPLDREELQTIQSEQDLYERISSGIIYGSDYAAVQIYAENMGIDRAEYDSMKRMYEENPEGGEAWRTLRAYCRHQSRIIRDKLIPSIYESVIQGEMSGKAQKYGLLLGIQEAQFQQLVILYQSEGEEVMKEKLLEYDKLLESIYDLSLRLFVTQEDGSAAIENANRSAENK